MNLRTALSFLLLSTAVFSLTLTSSPDKNMYRLSDGITYSGYVLLANSSTNATSGVNATTVTVALGGQTNTSVTNASGYYSVSFANPGAAGDYNINASVSYGGATWFVISPIKVLSFSNLFVWTDKDTYASGDNVTLSVRAEDVNGNGVNYAVNVSVWKFVNGTPVQNIVNMSGSTGAGTVAFTAFQLNDSGEYRAFVNSWMASKTFSVASFVVKVLTYDTSGNSVYTFSAGDTANITVTTTTAAGTAVSAVASGTVTLPNGTASALTSTTTSSGRASWAFNTSISGTYFVSLTAVRGTETKTTGTRFEAQSYSVEVFPAMTSQGPKSGFFPGQTVTMSMRVLDMSTKAEVTNISTGQITGSIFRGGTNVLNATVSGPTSANLYTLTFTAPGTAGRYTIVATVNSTGSTGRGYGSFVIQTAYATATVVDANGASKKMVQAGKTVYVRLDVSNSTANLTVSGTPGIEALYRDMQDVKGTVNASTIAYNATSRIYSFMLPTTAGPYYIRLNVNTTTGEAVLAETFFMSKLYDIMVAPYKSGSNVSAGFGGPFGFVSFNSTDTVGFNVTVTSASFSGKEFGAFGPSSGFAQGGGPSVGGGGGGPAGGGGAFMGGGGVGQEGTAVQGATITVNRVYNPDTFEDVTGKVTAIVSGVTDSNGKTSLTLRHNSQWSGGFYVVSLNVTDSNNGQDKGGGSFQIKNYMVWASVQSANATQAVGGAGMNWIIGRNDYINVTVSVNDPSNWQGVGNASVNITKILYQGKPGKFVWPPKVINVANGNCTTSSTAGPTMGTCLVTIPAPAGGWDSGFHNIVITTTKNVGGTLVSDTGMGFFETKTFMMIVEPVGWRFTYPPNWSPAFVVRVQYMNMTPVNGATVSIDSIKKVSDWPPTDLATSSYSSTQQTIGSSGNVTMTINPTGSWASADYVATISATSGNVTDTWEGFFQIRSFYSQLQPQSWAYSPNANITLNATASRQAPWAVWGGVQADPSDYINATLSNLRVTSWNQQTWTETDVSSSFNLSSTSVSGTALVNLTHPSALSPGSYQVAVTFTDAGGNAQVANSWFMVQAFQFNAWTFGGWSFSPGDSIPIQVFAYSPGSFGQNYTSAVNVSVTSLKSADTWPPVAISPSLWNSTNATIPANTGNSSLSLGLLSGIGSGRYIATLTATDGTSSQTSDIWFEVTTFKLDIWASSWFYAPNANITLNAHGYKPGTGLNLPLTVLNVTLRGWNDATGAPVTYAVTVNATTVNASYNGTTGWTTITLSPSPSWPMGGFDAGVVLRETVGNTTSTGHTWLSIMPFEVNSWPGKWKYMPGESITLNINVRIPGGAPYASPVSVGVTSIKTMPSFAAVNSSLYNVTNATGGSNVTITGNGTITVVPNAGFPSSGDIIVTVNASDAAAGLYASRDAFVSIGSYDVWLQPLQQMYSNAQSLTIQVNGWRPADSQQVNVSNVTSARIFSFNPLGPPTEYPVTNYSYNNATLTLTIPQPINGNVTLADGWYNIRVDTVAPIGGQSVASNGMGSFRISSGLLVTGTVTYGSNTGRNLRAFGPRQNVTVNVSVASASGNATVNFINASLIYSICTPGQPMCSEYPLQNVSINQSVTNNGTIMFAPPAGAWPLDFWTHYRGNLWYSSSNTTDSIFVEFDVTGALTAALSKQSYSTTDTISASVTALTPTGLNDSMGLNASVYSIRYWPPSQGEVQFTNFTNGFNQTNNSGSATVYAMLNGSATWPAGGIGVIICINYSANSRACDFFGTMVQQQALQLMNFIITGPTGVNQTFNLTTTVVNPTGTNAAGVSASVTLPYGLQNQSNMTQYLGTINGGASQNVTFALMTVSPGNWTVSISANTSTAGIGPAAMSGTVGLVNAPPVISSVNASQIGQNSATITWITDGNSNSNMSYGTNASSLNLSAINYNFVSPVHVITLANLNANTTYFYNVTSCIPSGLCSISAPRNFTTLPPAPPAITGVNASAIGPNFAVITWTTDANSNSSVNYSNTTYSSIAANSTLVGPLHSITLASLNANTTYYYNVTSCVPNNLCNTSANLNFTTLPPAPLALTANIASPANGSTTGNTTLLSATTSLVANCTYGTTPAAELGPMANTGGINHSQQLNFTSNNSVFPATRYVNCTAGNQSALTNVTWNVETRPPVISAVLNVSLNATVESIAWSTDKPSVNSSVRYWTSSPPGTVVSNTTSSTSPIVYLTGLAAGTYNYIVQAVDQYNNMAQFPPGPPLNFTKP